VQIIGRRKNVEYMGQNDGGACSVCNDGHDLCCPQFTIPLDSSDAFTGPLPSLTIPTGMNSGSLRIRFGFFTYLFTISRLNLPFLKLLLEFKCNEIEVYTSASSFDTAITSAATIPTVTIPTCTHSPPSPQMPE